MRENSMSTLVYLVLAQPIMNKKVPPFILQVFGTDNIFQTQDVIFRWQHTRDELARYFLSDTHSVKSQFFQQKLSNFRPEWNAAIFCYCNIYLNS